MLLVLHAGDAQRANQHQKKTQVRQEIDVDGDAALPLVTSSAPSNVTEFKCKSAGFFGNDADCTLFYRCVDYFGTGEHFSLFHFQCAPGTIFDESISVCNHPEWVSPKPKCMKAADDEQLAQGASNSQGSATGTDKPTISSSGTSGSASKPDSANQVSVTTEASTAGTTTCVCTTTPPSSSVFSTTPSTPAVELTQPTTTSVPTTTGSPAEGTTAPSVFTTDAASSASSSEPSTLAPPTQSSGTDAPTTIASSSGLPIVSPTTEATASATDAPTTVSGSTSESSQGSSNTASPIPTPPGVSPAHGNEAFVLVCGDQAFHRHPLDCKLYYQCIWSGFAFTFNLYSCLGDTLYDEASGVCTSPDKTSPCKLMTMPALPVVNVTALPGEGTTSVSPTTSATPQYTLAPGSLYDCPKPGHFAYQLDCIRFYRCFEISPGVLKGLLYRCPPGYGFSKVTERCEKEETIGTCDISVVRKGSIPVPVFPLEQAIMVPIKDFNYFFNNPNFFYFPRQSNRAILSN